jgi:hypothetical protein
MTYVTTTKLFIYCSVCYMQQLDQFFISYVMNTKLFVYGLLRATIIL